MTIKTIYIANDGTEFNDKQECEKYEKSKEIPENVLNAVKTLKIFCSKKGTWEVGDD